MAQANTQQRDDQRAAGGPPGADADKPTEIPAKGWFQVFKRGFKEAGQDQVPLLGAGVAFFAFLAIFPTLLATVTLYGLIVDPAVVASQIAGLTGSLPREIADIITQAVQNIQAQPRGAIITTVVTIALALWSASGGVSNLIKAINVAYDEPEKRSFIKLRLLALAFTLGAVVFMIVMLVLVVAAPAVLTSLVGDGPIRWLLEAARWVLLAVLVSTALAVLYRYAPDRDNPKFRWTSVGAGIATVLWLLASFGFTLYITLTGNSSYAKTFGALAGVVVLLMWLWITAYAILLGAEINAESEEQTVKDTTKGEPQPLGQRDAVKADSTPSGG